MKMKRPFVVSILITIIILFGALFFFQQKDAEISNVRWNFRKNPCDVSFRIKNKTRKDIICNISIIALRLRKGKSTSVVSEKGFMGEKTIEIKLYPEETRKIEETLKISGIANVIQVNAFNIRKNLNNP